MESYAYESNKDGTFNTNTATIIWNKIATKIIQLNEIIFQEFLAWVSPVFAKMDTGNRKYKGPARCYWPQSGRCLQKGFCAIVSSLLFARSAVRTKHTHVHRVKITLSTYSVSLQTNLLCRQRDVIGIWLKGRAQLSDQVYAIGRLQLD